MTNTDEDLEERVTQLEDDIDSLESRVETIGERYVGLDRIEERLDSLQGIVLEHFSAVYDDADGGGE